MNFAYALCLVLLLGGCSSLIPTFNLEQAINQYNAAKESIKLGDTKESVLKSFEKSQNFLTDEKWRRSPDSYVKNNVVVDIYYFRSDFTPDGLTTDDEFTPYLFNDGRLVGIGWEVIGGPKTKGQSLMPYQAKPGVREQSIVY